MHLSGVIAFGVSADLYGVSAKHEAMFRAIRESQRPETLLIPVPGSGDDTDQELAATRDACRAVVAANSERRVAQGCSD
jgi:hypothetical protein